MDKSSYQVRLDHWKLLLQDQSSSGISKSAWCKDHGINLRQFFYWQRRVRTSILESSGQLPAAPSPDVPATTFCELSMPSRTPISPSDCDDPDLIIEINGCRILVGKSVSKKSLTTVIEVLRHV